MATAQNPSMVGDILDRGGKRVSPDDLTSMISGATITGAQVGRPQTTFENVHRPNGIPLRAVAQLNRNEVAIASKPAIPSSRFSGAQVSK